MPEEKSQLSVEFEKVGDSLDRIVKALRREKQASDYPYYIKFTSSGNDSWFAQSGLEQYEGISSVVWKVNSPELNDFESNLTAPGYAITEGQAQNFQHFYYGYLLWAGMMHLPQSEFYEDIKEEMRNGTYNYGELIIRDKQIISCDTTMFQAEICDASEF